MVEAVHPVVTEKKSTAGDRSQQPDHDDLQQRRNHRCRGGFREHMVKNKWFIGLSMTITFAVLLIVATSSANQPLLAPSLTILYPKHNSAVGKRVNFVLDPMTDWATVPFFQVSVGANDYPVVDTSTSRHAVQGLLLQPGVNLITVKALAPLPGVEKGEVSQKYQVLVSQSITVYNREGTFSIVPEIYRPQYFHSREHESDCSGCHRMDAEPKDQDAANPEDVLCYTCHRSIPSGKHIHGPAAVWNCLACHNPDLYPVKYVFTFADPWTVGRSSQPVEPAVFTIAADNLFLPRSSSLLSSTVPAVPMDKKRSKEKTQELLNARAEEIRKRQEQERDLFKDVLEYLQMNPMDQVRIEAHTDTTPLPKPSGKKAVGLKTLGQLTASQAKAVSGLLKKYGVAGKNRVLAVGMGSTLPKAPNTSVENRALNNRIEIVVYPAGVNVQNSLKLPLLKDRDRMMVKMTYSKGAASVRGLKVVERLPRGMHYVKGTAVFRGRVKEPLAKGEDLVWALGDLGTDFQETLTFIVKRDKGIDAEVNPVTHLRFTIGTKEESRDFDPLKPYKVGMTVKETCEKCHPGLLSGPVKHGPADAGDCNLCHDPHGSNYPAWTRKQSWRLCTTCHAEKAKDVHVIAGFVYGDSHPTRKWPDPSRPGKRLACISCHSPHSGESSGLFAYSIRSKYELCGLCHAKK